MSKHNTPKIPLHMQSEDVRKTAKQNPSYESFRDNKVHPTAQYNNMWEEDNRPSTHAMARMRRYPDGKLDYEWAALTVVGAVQKAEEGYYLAPVEESLLTVVFPMKFRMVDPQMADVRTKLSRSEKAFLREIVEGKLKEQLNWNAGYGGGSVSGRTRSTSY